MTTGAFDQAMSLGEREGRMIEPGVIPCNTIDGMTIRTLGRIAPKHVVGVGGCQIIGLMAIIAFDTQGIEPEQGFRFMALGTINHIMGSQERKPAALMDFRYIFNQP